MRKDAVSRGARPLHSGAAVQRRSSQLPEAPGPRATNSATGLREVTPPPAASGPTYDSLEASSMPPIPRSVRAVYSGLSDTSRISTPRLGTLRSLRTPATPKCALCSLRRRRQNPILVA